MGDVVSLATHKDDPHMTGKARCIACEHEFVSVAPVGAKWLTCPNCQGEKALLKFSCLVEGAAHWECNCGNDLFHATKDGFYCPNCGVWQKGF